MAIIDLIKALVGLTISREHITKTLDNTNKPTRSPSMSSIDSNQSDASLWSEDSSQISATSTCSDVEEEAFTKPDSYAHSDRRSEVRDARLANALIALDEDIPMEIDRSIKELFDRHATNLSDIETVTKNALANIRQQHVIARATRQCLPISKRGLARKEAMRTST